jgi:hypothetical protein
MQIVLACVRFPPLETQARQGRPFTSPAQPDTRRPRPADLEYGSPLQDQLHPSRRQTAEESPRYSSRLLARLSTAYKPPILPECPGHVDALSPRRPLYQPWQAVQARSSTITGPRRSDRPSID